MKTFLIATIAAFCSLAAPIWAQGDPTFDFSETDPGMSAAITSARNTLDAFLSNTMVDGQSAQQTMLKVDIPTPTTDEVIWITPFARTSDTEWVGILANQPAFIEGAKVGDKITFSTAQIADWAFFGDDGLMYGGYTLREMVASGAVAADAMPTMSDDPVPAKW